MRITRDNYEVFFIDYLDGNLSATEIAELKNFLLLHPDLAEELDDFENNMLEIDDHIQIDKSSLKSIPYKYLSVNASNLNEYLIGKFENDLSPEETDELEDYLQLHPEKRMDEQLFSKAFLKPDQSIICKGKAKLKRHPLHRFRRTLVPLTSIAAAAAVALIIVFNTNDKSETNTSLSSAVQLTIDSKTPTSNTDEKEIVKEDIVKKQTSNKEPIIVKVIKTDRLNTDKTIEETPINIEKNDLKKVSPIHAKEIDLKQSMQPVQLAVIVSEQQNPIYQLHKSFRKPTLPSNREDLAFTLLEYGVKGYNLLTENNAEFNRKTDDSGNIDLAFNSQLFGFQAKMKK